MVVGLLVYLKLGVDWDEASRVARARALAKSETMATVSLGSADAQKEVAEEAIAKEEAIEKRERDRRSFDDLLSMASSERSRDSTVELSPQAT